MLGGMWNAQAVPAGYGGWWSVVWLALVLAALAGYVAFGVRRARWPGLGVAAVAGLALAAAGVIAPGRDLLRVLAGADHFLHLPGTALNDPVLAPAAVTALREWARPYARQPSADRETIARSGN